VANSPTINLRVEWDTLDYIEELRRSQDRSSFIRRMVKEGLAFCELKEAGIDPVGMSREEVLDKAAELRAERRREG
jgi:hypothetical protein